MEDRDIVAAIVAGNPAGLAQAYDRYAAPLFTYCRTLLRVSADAADAVQDTFVIASAKVSGLRDPDKLRTWLYAVARNECYRRLRSREIAPGLDEVPDMTDESAEVSANAERTELQYLVKDALTGLNPSEREVLELNLRHDYDSAELADALGVSRNHAHAMLSRARNQLKTSLGALLVARTGRQACAELDGMLASWDGQMSILLRKRVNRHIDSCDTCGERRRRELTPAALFSLLPLAALPPGFRDRVLRLCADSTPQSVQYRAKVTQQAGSFTTAGFPAAAMAPSGRWRAVRRNTLLAAPAAIAMVAACVIFVALAATGSNAANQMTISPLVIGTQNSGSPSTAISSPATPGSPTPSASQTARRKAGALRPTPIPQTSSTIPSPTATTPSPSQRPPAKPTPKPTHSAKPTPAPSSTKPKPPPSTAPPSPTPSPTIRAGTLQVSTNVVVLAAADNGAPFGAFTLTAAGGPVSLYWLTVASGALTASPASGTLAAGQSVTITLSMTRSESIDTQIVIEPGDVTVTVEYTPQRIDS